MIDLTQEEIRYIIYNLERRIEDVYYVDDLSEEAKNIMRIIDKLKKSNN